MPLIELLQRSEQFRLLGFGTQFASECVRSESRNRLFGSSGSASWDFMEELWVAMVKEFRRMEDEIEEWPAGIHEDMLSQLISVGQILEVSLKKDWISATVAGLRDTQMARYTPMTEEERAAILERCFGGQ